MSHRVSVMTPCVVGLFSLVILEKSEYNIFFLPRSLNPIPPGLFEGGSAWGGEGGGSGRCTRPITPKLLTIME